jgi:hypothetical protein
MPPGAAAFGASEEVDEESEAGHGQTLSETYRAKGLLVVRLRPAGVSASSDARANLNRLRAIPAMQVF